MTDSLIDLSVSAFSEELASKAPVPGGGGAAAVAGALAAALGEMVCNLTLGKPKYAEYEAAVFLDVAELNKYRQELLDLIDADARAYATVSAAYRIPKTDESREAALQAALQTAAQPPLEMMRVLGEVVCVLDGLCDHSNPLVLSDIGCAAILAAAALQAASLNVLVNAQAMKDAAQKLQLILDMTKYSAWVNTAQNIYMRVSRTLMGNE